MHPTTQSTYIYQSHRLSTICPCPCHISPIGYATHLSLSQPGQSHWLPRLPALLALLSPAWVAWVAWAHRAHGCMGVTGCMDTWAQGCKVCMGCMGACKHGCVGAWTHVWMVHLKGCNICVGLSQGRNICVDLPSYACLVGRRYPYMNINSLTE